MFFMTGIGKLFHLFVVGFEVAVKFVMEAVFHVATKKKKEVHPAQPAAEKQNSCLLHGCMIGVFLVALTALIFTFLLVILLRSVRH